MSKALGLGKQQKVGELETLLEVTDWEYPNHTYLLDKGKGWLVGYRSVVNGEIKIYKSPMKQFSKSRRKFKKVVDKELERAYTV
jgi:hypothetical protein